MINEQVREKVALKTIEEKVAMFSAFMKTYKNEDGYVLPYYEEEITVCISDEEVTHIIEQAIILMDEVARLGNEWLPIVKNMYKYN